MQGVDRRLKGKRAMKINVEVDCTPEEARRAVGLPDLSPIHERYTQMMIEAMSGSVKPEMLETMMRGWQPMGEAGMNFWRQMFDSAARPKGD